MVDAAPGTLYVVSTPIGNMGDFSFRGVEVLKAATLVLAEDTRHARGLLSHFGIKARLNSYHEHNEAERTPSVVRQLMQGADVALISDAGTPLLSDPGERLVAASIEAGAKVVAVPGASAVLSALVVSGLPASPFTFYGFLPRRGAVRGVLLREIAGNPHTSVLYEAANRLPATLDELAGLCSPTRKCVVAREITKLFEETRRGTLLDNAAYYSNTPARGEVVLLLAGQPPLAPSESDWRKVAHSLFERGLSTRDAVSIMVKEHGAPRNVAYKLMREL
jgi:16S rRNA (cytidine1402-2'-O)-methyltransferase